MYMGSDATGVFQGRGQFQNLEIYSFPLNAAEIAQNHANVSAVILDWGGYVPHNGDVIQLWNTNSQAFTNYLFTSGAWSTTCPIVGVGDPLEVGFVPRRPSGCVNESPTICETLH